MDTVRTFDAFPKINSQHSVRSTRGGLSTILTTFMGLLIFWVEVGGYIGGYIDHQFTLDNSIKQDIAINIDMMIAMPCEFLHTNVLDITDDRFLAGELLNFEGTNFFVPSTFNIDSEKEVVNVELNQVFAENMRAEYQVQGSRLNEGAPACHIFGSIPVNHVNGDFHITAKGYGYQDRNHVDLQSLNFSHVIAEFSYGEFFPFMNNPLDFTGRITNDHLQSYKYYTKIVPTHYEKLGLEVDTHQYALTEQHVTYKAREGIPGIFFKYDFEPIKLIIKEQRMSFIQFVARIGTILAGIMIVAGYFYRLYDRLLTILFGKRYASKDDEKKQGGILDSKQY
ncbi:uncharacterized protein KQ657_004829 [Scheffersomyces spartinae]|uniref:Endoplasmic reticulum-Golgi intermediate compartment protein n=1 Tax=Scheffersomyces spartinae TaxID=45513 RepID=A0A9P7VAP4_9ASCO|nr:uncharacterized protein KQ657_004829 [Scheffersomyces spartinae]KAG7194121.1 hypothetical protein KQ657_004829 [Scheffersomyces spartinae]